ncbi:MAG: hypothetical protein RI884_325, partial [Pseudomonadota bacterium]
VGQVPGGLRRMVPILGGQVQGEGWTGRVLPGGADFQWIVGQTVAHLDARYIIETDGGDRIFVQNRAVRAASAEVTAKLLRGEPVDPSQVYFRCSPSFETASPALGWINERIFVGTGARHPDQVVLRCYTLT